MQLQMGDKIRVSSVFGTTHYGIYIGPYLWLEHAVVHNDKNGGVQVVDLDTFANGRSVAIEARVIGRWWERRVVADRALALVGREYDLFNFNCEHLVSFAQTGVARSPQVEALVLVLLVGLGIALVANS